MTSLANGGIYAIRNTVNGHSYVGQASHFTTRFQHHRWHLQRGTHHSQPLQRAWRKYDPCAFVFDVLERVTDSNLLIEREQHWIDALRPEYNVAPVAGSSLGLRRAPRSEQWRLKQRVAKLGKPTGRQPSPEHRQKMIEGQRRSIIDGSYQRIQSAETRAKIGVANSRALTGRSLDDEHRTAISTGLKGKPWSAARRAAGPLRITPQGVAKSAAARRGQKRSPEARERMRQAALRRTAAPAYRERMSATAKERRVAPSMDARRKGGEARKRASMTESVS